MKIQSGEIIKLSNNKEYICCGTVADNGIDYVYLMSNFKPLEIKFARQAIVNDEIEITVIGSKEEKEKVLKLFQDSLKG